MPCRSIQFSGSTVQHAIWRNWANLAGGPVAAFHEPDSLGDIVGVVQDAEAADQRVRVVGSGWAFEDIAWSPDIMVSLVRLQAVLNYVTEPAARALLAPTLPNGRTLVHVEAGIKVAALNEALAARGLAMPTLGGANGQSVVGALSTSTHGGDFAEPPFPDLVHAVHLVGVGGQEYWIERASAPVTNSGRLGYVLPCPDTLIVRDDELFNAVIVGLGRFGVIYSVILETVPAYSLGRERTVMPLGRVLDRLRNGIDADSFLDPLLADLPPASPALAAQTVRPRAMELVIDSRNTANVHVLRRWEAVGADFEMAFSANPLCDAGSIPIILAAASALAPLGMDPLALSSPLLVTDPSRPIRLGIRQAQLLTLIANTQMTPGQTLAQVTNAYGEFGIVKVPDLLALVVYSGQFKTQRGPSYAVMTGDPAFAASTCYRANSCEIMFDAADQSYVDFVEQVATAAPRFNQAGYISLRYSRRSQALLSMHNVTGTQAVSVEVSTLDHLTDSQVWMDTVLAMAANHNGRPHWGQQNTLSEAAVQQLYGGNLDRWRAVLSGFSDDSEIFSNGFCAQRGLEPRGHRPILVEGTAAQLASALPTAVTGLLLVDQPQPRPAPQPRPERQRPPIGAITSLIMDTAGL